MTRRLQISFSGGETSADMTEWALRELVYWYDEWVVVFANTGWENEATLEFVRQCDEQLGFSTVWLEAVVQHGRRQASTSRVVDFASASRHQEPFGDVVSKYGIPNPSFLHCTRELKTNPMRHYCREVLGWGTDYDTAIGIRADEIDRMTPYRPHRLIYPYITDRPTTKPQVNARWAARPFRLNLKGYQGNCRACYKKSDRKLLTIAEETPEAFDFASEMEAAHPQTGPEFRKETPPAYKARRWYRGHRTVEDIFGELRKRQAEGFERAHDDAQVFDPDLDVDGGCGSEACEPFVGDNDT